jgi:ferredoxin
MKIDVDRKRCQGHGRCYGLAPDVFEPDEEGYVALMVTGELPPTSVPDARLAVDTCPESALRLVADPD